MSLRSPYLSLRVDPTLAQSAKAFAFYQDSPSLADTSEHPLVLFKNTAAVDAVIVARVLQARSANNATLRYYATPTITSAGTPATPTPRKLGGAASAMSLYTGSSISANGTLIDLISSSGFAVPTVNDIPIVVAASTNLLITYQASATAAAVLHGIDWVEV